MEEAEALKDTVVSSSVAGFWASHPRSALLFHGTSSVVSSVIDANGLNKTALKKKKSLVIFRRLNSFIMIAGYDH